MIILTSLTIQIVLEIISISACIIVRSVISILNLFVFVWLR